MAQAQDTHFTAEEQAAFHEVIQLLEASPDADSESRVYA